MSALVAADHPVLRAPARPVERPTQRTLAPLAKRLRAVGRAMGGVGVAAPQIGVDLRVFVIEWEGHRLAVADPTIEYVGDRRSRGQEGCLSLPGQWFEVERADEIVLAGYDIDAGRRRRWPMAGYLTRIVGHEMDHLDGVLIDQRGRPLTGKTA